MNGKQSMADEKRRIRKNVLALRDAIKPNILTEMSAQIIKRLIRTEEYRKAEALLTYVNYQSEVVTTSLIEHSLAEGKHVYVPKVIENDMDFYRITGMKSLTKGYRGILEPADGEIFAKNNSYTLMIMPGAVFDEKCHRIGYGKGFYDRYLMRMEDLGIDIHTLALCFECQILCEIPHERHDRKPDLMISEKRMIERKQTKGECSCVS